MRLRAHPFLTVTGIVLLLAISVTTFFVDGLQWSFPAFAVFLAIISLSVPGAIAGTRRAAAMTRASRRAYSSLHRGLKVICCVPARAALKMRAASGMACLIARLDLIARCADVSDVQSAVRAASQNGVLTAVRCGGHSLAGFSTCDGGLVIDLCKNAAGHS